MRALRPRCSPAAGPHAALSQPPLGMESLAFPWRPGPAPPAAAALADGLKSPKPLMKRQAVKRHHHKHNLRHRYEFLGTLGKGTYGKVKKARESSGRLVSALLRGLAPVLTKLRVRGLGGLGGCLLQVYQALIVGTMVVDLRTPRARGSR